MDKESEKKMNKSTLNVLVIVSLLFIFMRLTIGIATNEVDIDVLNEQSYPIVGENWTIMFNTSWLGNLTISPINGTSYAEFYEDDLDTVDDLDIMKLRCGNLTLFDRESLTSTNNTYLILENNSLIKINEAINKSLKIKSIFVDNYLCDNFTGNYTVRVLTSGKHHLKLEFNNKKDYASNVAAEGTDTDTGEGMSLQFNFYVYGANWSDGVPCDIAAHCMSGVCTGGYCVNDWNGTQGSDEDTGGGMLLKYKFYVYAENGAPCAGSNQCQSDNCVYQITDLSASGTKYCADTGKECSLSGTIGYEAADTYDSGGVSYICKGDDLGGDDCGTSTTGQCDEWAGKYCNGAGAWTVGDSYQLDAACGACTWCGGTAGTDGDISCVNQASGDAFNDCGAIQCDNGGDLPYYYHGWSSLECYYKDDVAAGDADCDGSGGCKTDAVECGEEGQGITTGTVCDCVDVQTGCTGTTAGSCGVCDTCTYSGSGNWNISGADNCVLNQNYDLGGYNITINGSGTFRFNGSNITNYGAVVIRGTSATDRLNVTCDKGGCFRD